MKIYARQVPPEYQESPLFLGEEFFPENIILEGNRDYQSRTTPLYDKLPDILEELSAVWDNMQNGFYNSVSWAVELAEIAPPEGRGAYTREERKNGWPGLLHRYIDAAYLTKQLLCDALELITGQKWEAATIRGCCQGDWQNVIYPASYGWEWLKSFETEYFNTGSEWFVHDGENAPDSPEDIDGFSVYCHGWSDEQIKQEICDAYGAAGEVILYKFSGWSRHASYTMEAAQ